VKGDPVEFTLTIGDYTVEFFKLSEIRREEIMRESMLLKSSVSEEEIIFPVLILCTNIQY
jgi:hypothetical protein